MNNRKKHTCLPGHTQSDLTDLWMRVSADLKYQATGTDWAATLDLTQRGIKAGIEILTLLWLE